MTTSDSADQGRSVIGAWQLVIRPSQLSTLGSLLSYTVSLSLSPRIGHWSFALVRVEENAVVMEDGVDVQMAYPRELRSLWTGADVILGRHGQDDKDCNSRYRITVSYLLTEGRLSLLRLIAWARRYPTNA